MKKIKKSALFILVISIMMSSLLNVKAQNMAIVGDNSSELKSYHLEDLIKEKEEQKRIKNASQNIEIPSLPFSVNPQMTLDGVSRTSGDTSVNAPYNATLLERVDGNNYLWYVTQYSYATANSPFTIYRHNISTNTNDEVYTSDSNIATKVVTYYYNNDVVYVLYVKNYDTSKPWGYEYSTSSVVGVNIKTGKVVYNQDFATSQDLKYLPSFAVDNNQRFYFVYKSTGTKIFDKTGKLLYDHKPVEGDYINFIKGVSPNGKALFFEVMYQINEYAYFQSVYEGIQKLDNGVFVNKENYTVYGRGELGLSTNYSYNPRWVFLDSAGTYAADQYGRIVKFDYNSSNTIGVDKEVLFSLGTSVQDYTIYEPAFSNTCKNGNDIYMMGTGGNIYKITQSGDKFTLTGKYLSLGFSEYHEDGIGYEDINTMICSDNNMIISYNSGGTFVKKVALTDSNLKSVQNITITDHISMKHTQDDIKNKYKQTMPTFNYNTSIYKSNPNYKAPFGEGSLKAQVIKDALNTLNYNRWIVGVPEITLNSNKMARSQKCALISRVNGKISHTPTKPNGMSDAFYQEAYDGCYAKYQDGDTYSGNVAYGDDAPYEALRGFISDLYNISLESATGHRQSMLDPKATQISFGYADTYSAASIYYDPDKALNEKYYAFPSAGYFPSEEMKLNEYWSIYVAEKGISGTASVRFTYKGKQYTGNSLVWESGYPVLSFKMPSELINLIGSENSNVPSGTSIQVEVLGIKDKDLNNLTYKYTVNFFNADTSRHITSVSLDKTSISLVKGQTGKVNVTINPSNTTDSKLLTWHNSNSKVVSVDTKGNIKALAAGTAKITVITSNGKTATVNVTVTNPNTPIKSVKINQGNISIGVNKTSKLTATINPSNTTQSKALTWASSNKKIAIVDKNGNVKGIKAGTANITVKTSNGKTATIKVTVKKPTPIKSVKLNKKTLKLELGKSATVKATINPSNTTDSKVLTWSTSNKKVAIVDKNGKITAVGGGSATITVKTSNKKKATVKVTVSKINAKKATISAIKNQVQTGKSLKPTVQVKLNGKVLKNGKDYTVSYKNNKKAGKATLTVKFKGNYTGTKTGSFIIIPSKVNIKNPSTSKKSIKVKYSKVSGAKYYQTAYRLKGTNKWSYTTKSKISKLTSGKEYEIMVRAGIKSGSKTLYGSWSNVKTIKVK